MIPFTSIVLKTGRRLEEVSLNKREFFFGNRLKEKMKTKKIIVIGVTTTVILEIVFNRFIRLLKGE